MSTYTATAARPARGRASARRVRVVLTALSARLHAPGDARAREVGWTVTVVPGPLGLTGRSYRDPRFSARAGTVTGMRDHQPPRSPERDQDATPAQRATYTARLVPPAAEHPPARTQIARRLADAERPPDRPDRTGDTISRRHAARVVARLGQIHAQAAAGPEPEAGA